jgi:hypothetical protein
LTEKSAAFRLLKKTDMNASPLSMPPSAPKTSAGAIWSLVLGILGLICFSILTAIPAVICGHMAYSRIKRSSGALEGKGLAIAGLITGYLGIAWAIVFIPLMAAIAIPNFVKARETAQRNACINNLRQIDAAKQMWAVEKGKSQDAVPTPADLGPYLPNFAGLKCLKGGVYQINAVNRPATCSVPGHTLEDEMQPTERMRRL